MKTKKHTKKLEMRFTKILFFFSFLSYLIVVVRFLSSRMMILSEKWKSTI